ncbi:MAG: DUF2878 domain-containing protein [Psychromonas sp.]
MLKVNHKQFFWLNFVCFQLVWFISVYLGNQGIAYLCMLLVVHFYFSPSRLHDLKTVFLIAPIGMIADSLLSKAGIFVFADGSLLPIWLAFLWAYFALTLNHGLSWLKRMPIYLQAIIGAVSGPLSYYAGYKMGGVALPEGIIKSLFVLAVIWAALLPVYLIVLSYLDRSNHGVIQNKQK